MRPGRRSLLAVLVAVLAASLLLLPTASAGSEDRPEISDGSNDQGGTPATPQEWADLRSVWITEPFRDELLSFHVNVTTVGSQPDTARWDVNFTVEETNWTARISYDGEFQGNILRNGSTIGAALNVRRDGSILELNWTDHERHLPGDGLLTDTFALSDASRATDIEGAQTGCHGQQVIDCAPNDGFGDDFQLGVVPAAGLGLAVDPTNVTSQVDRNVTFTLTADNTGPDRVKATYNVTFPDGFTVNLSDADVTLQSGDTVDRTLTVHVGSEVALNTTYNGTITLVPDRGFNRTINVTITAVPPPPPPPPYALGISVVPPRETVEPGGTAEHEVTVTNQGTEGDVIDVEITGGPGWGDLSKRQLRLAPNGSETVTLTIRVPDDAGTGEETTRVVATSRGDRNVTASAFALTSVETAGGFVQELDRTLQAMGLGGLLPVAALLVIVVVLVVYLVVAWRRRRRLVDVDADWSEGEEAPDAPDEADGDEEV